jgi:hypothetical protein
MLNTSFFFVSAMMELECEVDKGNVPMLSLVEGEMLREEECSAIARTLCVPLPPSKHESSVTGYLLILANWAVYHVTATPLSTIIPLDRLGPRVPCINLAICILSSSVPPDSFMIKSRTSFL